MPQQVVDPQTIEVDPGEIHSIEVDPSELERFERASQVEYTTPEGIPVFTRAPAAPAQPPAQPQPQVWSPEWLGQQTLSGLGTAAEATHHVIANTAGLIDTAFEKISALTGIPKHTVTQLIPTIYPDQFKDIAGWAKRQEAEQKLFAGEMAGGRQDIPSQTVRAVTAGIGSLPMYAGATALGGPVLGMAGLSALETADQGWQNQLKAAGYGALLGKAFKVLEPYKRYLRSFANAAITYVNLIAHGANHETALSNAIAMGGLGAMGGPGEKTLRDVPATAGQVVREMDPRRLIPQVKTVLSPQEQASEQYMREHGIQTPLSMQTGSKAAAGLEGTVQSMPGGGRFTEKMAQAREQLTGPVAQQELGQIYPERVTPEEAGTAVQRTLGKTLEETRAGLAEEVLPGQPMTPEAAGTAVLERGKQEIQALDQQADASYKAAWQAERDPRNIRQIETVDADGNPTTEKMALPIDMADVQKALKPLADRYEYTLRETDIRASLGLKAMRNIINGPRYKPASAAELDLGMLKEAARTEGGLAELRDPSQGLAAKSVAELQNAIDQTMANAAYPGYDPASGAPSPALTNLQAGRKATAQKHEIADVYRGFGRQNITELEPVQVYRGLTWEGDAGIQRLRQVAKIAPEQMAQVGRAFIEGGGKWETLGPETRKELFTDPGLIKDLDAYYAKLEKFGPLLKLEPVALFDRLTARGGKRINLTQEIAAETPEHKAQIARAFVEGLLERATREGDIQKVQSTLDKWLDLDEKTKATLIEDPKQVRNLNNLFMSMKRVMKTPNPSGSGFIMALNQMKGNIFKGIGMIAGGGVGYGHGAPGAGAGAGVGYLAGAAAEYGANAALARLLFNQRFIKMLTRGFNEAARGNTAGAKLSARSLSKIIDENPPEGPPEGPPTGGGPPPGGAPPPAPPAGAGEPQHGTLKHFLESESGEMTIPPRKGTPEGDYTKHIPPPEGELVSPLKPLQPPELRRSGKLEGSLHYLRRAAEREPGVGGPDNKRTVLRDANGEFVVGEITPEDWIQRVKKQLSPEELREAREWYKQLFAFFTENFGEKQGPKMALAWLSSQQNISPSGGMTNVLRALDQLRGMPKEKIAGLAEAKILDALQGKVPEGGYGAKLNDFVDSAMGKTTRTWMGDDPRGGQPAVIDVWANRDVGKIDDKLLTYLTNRFGKEAVKRLKLDGNAIGETDYEYGSRFYNDLIGNLNKSGFDGGGWTGEQVQAVGWTAMQKAMGATPEFARDLIIKNTRRYGWEVHPGEGAPILEQYPWQDLSIEQQAKVSDYVGSRVTDLAAKLTGAKITNRQVTRGAYLGKPTISVQMDVFASPETFRDFGRAAGYLGQQSEVWHVRPLKSGNSWAYSIRGEKGLDTPEVQQQFWEKLRDRVGANLVPGYSPMGGETGNGIFIVNPFNRKYLFERAKAGFKTDTSLRPWTAQDKAKIKAAINEVEAEMGLSLEVGFDKVDLGASLHNWARKGKKNGHLQRLVETGRSDLADRLSNHAPDTLPWWKEAWEQAGGEGRPGPREGKNPKRR